MPRAARVILLLVSALIAPALVAQPSNIFLLDGEPPRRAIFTRHTHVPALPPTNGALESRMARAVLALTGAADDETTLNALIRSVDRRRHAPYEGQSPERVCVVHLDRDGTSKSVEVVVAPDGTLVAREIRGGDATGRQALDPDRFLPLLDGAIHYQGGFDPPDLPVGVVSELDKPYVTGDVFLDRRELGRRIYRGKRTRVMGATRNLENETMFVRLPNGYDPRHPDGLLVWIDPTDSGRPPQPLFEAADRLGLVLVGVANAGNGRPFVDRMQLAFDMIATVRARYHIDESRVYVTGMSGGGRISSMLIGTYPDVFAGAVPIVGLNSYKRASVKGKMAPSTFSKPSRELFALLKERRIAPMSGPPDFNYEQMQAYADGLERDGLAIRFFDYPDMDHVMPTPERFVEAMTWVDEPWRTKREEAESRAAELLERAGDDTETLVEVTETAPWSEAAWEALDRLGVRPE